MSKAFQQQHFIVVLGRQWRNGLFETEPAQCQNRQINNTVVISTPDASNLKGEHMLDLMALTNPGPHLFLVVLDEGRQQEGELRKWEKVFGEDIFHNMRYITDGRYDYSRFPDKCIPICEDRELIKQCEDIIKKDIGYLYRFGGRIKMICFEEILKHKMEQIGRAAEMDQSKSPLDYHNPDAGGQQLTLVLLGESGSGKSASGNTIMGETAFKSEPSAMPVTTECKMETKSVCGTEVKVIDTPDFFDEDLQEPHIQDCIQRCEGGLCVYLLVIQIGRFTEGERDILERLERALETRVRDRAIILFTRGDDLRFPIDEYVRDTTPFLQQLIMKCGERYQVFNNTTLATQQPNEKGGKWWLKELMEKIAELVKMTDRVTKSSCR